MGVRAISSVPSWGAALYSSAVHLNANTEEGAECIDFLGRNRATTLPGFLDPL